MSSIQEARQFAEMELRINRLKKEMDGALIRFYSDESESEGKLWALRESLAEISLRNCKEIVRYIRQVSPGAANDLDMRRRSVTRDLRRVERSHDLASLHRWYKEELAPLLKGTEQAGYLVAATSRRSLGDRADGFRWKVGESPGGEEHIKRFGKTADEFRYLDQTCPVCGNRIDEMGWCSCGTIGGG